VNLSGAPWRTSSYSGGNGGQCVEVTAISSPDSPERLCVVRDSKNPEGPVLAFSPGQWRAFARRVKARTLGLAGTQG
jgi:hypothetical protein